MYNLLSVHFIASMYNILSVCTIHCLYVQYIVNMYNILPVYTTVSRIYVFKVCTIYLQRIEYIYTLHTYVFVIVFCIFVGAKCTDCTYISHYLQCCSLHTADLSVYTTYLSLPPVCLSICVNILVC